MRRLNCDNIMIRVMIVALPLVMGALLVAGIVDWKDTDGKVTAIIGGAGLLGMLVSFIAVYRNSCRAAPASQANNAASSFAPAVDKTNYSALKDQTDTTAPTVVATV